MRLPVRPLVTSAACAALALWAAAPVAAADGDVPQAPSAVEEGPSPGGADAASAAPGTEALRRQVAAMPQNSEVLTSVNRLLNAVLDADNHQLSRAEGRRHVTEAENVAATQPAPQAQGRPGTAMAPTVPKSRPQTARVQQAR